MSTTINKMEDTLRDLVPKKCKIVNGRLHGGFVDWNCEKGTKRYYRGLD